MKEQYRSIELTNTHAQPTLRTGTISMDNGQNEQPPQRRFMGLRIPFGRGGQRPPEPARAGGIGVADIHANRPGTPAPENTASGAGRVVRQGGEIKLQDASADLQKQARVAWEAHYNGKLPINVDERRTVEGMIRFGIPPPQVDMAAQFAAALPPELQAKMRKVKQQGRPPGGKEIYYHVPPAGLPSIDPTRYNPAVANERLLHEIADELNSLSPDDRDLERLTEALSDLKTARHQGTVDMVKAKELNDILRAHQKGERRKLQEQREQDRLESGKFIQYLGAPERRRLESGDEHEILGWLDTAFDRLYRLPVQGALAESPEFQQFSNAYREARRIVRDESESSKPLRPGQRPRMTQAETDKALDELDDRFYTTYHNMVMRAQITLASKVEQVLNYAGQMKTHYLMRGFAMEEGRAGIMYQLIDDYVETRRLGSPQQHVTPEIIAEATGEDPSSTFIQAQVRLALADFGPFAEIAARGVPQGSLVTIEQHVEAAVIRAVRTGYNLWVNTGRQAVVVSRGRRLEEGQYLSDPIGPFAFYNIEEFSPEKWENRSADVVKLKEQSKLYLANNYLKSHSHLHLSHPEKIELGERLFKEFINIADFFSSGWRMGKIFDNIQDRCDAIWNPDVKYAFKPKTGSRFIVRDFPLDPQRQARAKYAEARAKEMALFMQLIDQRDGRKYPYEHPHDSKDRDDLRKKHEALQQIWRKISMYHPEEAVRLYQERVADDISATYSEDHKQKVDDLNDPNIRFPHSPRTRALYIKYRELFSNPIFVGNGIRHYKDFKEFKVDVHGRQVPLALILNTIRQEGYGMMQQVNFGDPTAAPWVHQRLVSMVGLAMAGQVKDMYAAFTRFNTASIEELMNNDKFEDTYMSKVLKTDDALLGEMENDGFSQQAKEGIRKIGGYIDPAGNFIPPTIPQPRLSVAVAPVDVVLGAETKPFAVLSKRYSSEGRGDAMVRWLGDSSSTEKAIGTHLLNIYKLEGIEAKAKEARAMADQIINYNGVDNAVEGVEATLMVYMDLTKLDYFAEMIGLEGYPLRRAASKAQRLLGVHAEALSQNKRRETLDHFKDLLIKRRATLSEEEKKLPPKEQARILRERRHAAEDEWHKIENKLKVTGKHFVGTRGPSLLLLLALLLGAEVFNMLELDQMMGKKK